LIFLLPSILLIILYILLHRLSSWFGFDGTVMSWLTSYLSSRSFVVSINSTSSATSPLLPHKDQSLDHSYSYSTLVLSVPLSLIRLAAIIYLLMTLNCSSPSGHLNSLPICYTYKIQLISSLNRCLQIFSHAINLKLSFF